MTRRRGKGGDLKRLRHELVTQGKVGPVEDVQAPALVPLASGRRRALKRPSGRPIRGGPHGRGRFLSKLLHVRGHESRDFATNRRHLCSWMGRRAGD